MLTFGMLRMLLLGEMLGHVFTLSAEAWSGNGYILDTSGGKWEVKGTHVRSNLVNNCMDIANKLSGEDLPTGFCWRV